jgi:hypothetical protein
MIPITQVWVAREWGGSNDPNTPHVSDTELYAKSMYHRWPTDGSPGQALIKKPPVLFSNICEQQLNNGGTGNTQDKVNTRGKKTDKESIEDKTKSGDSDRSEGKTQQQIDTLGKQFARMYYVEHAFKQQTVTINVHWLLYSDMIKLLGQNIQFTVPFESGTSVGHLTSIQLTIDRPANKAVCVLSLTHVRSAEDNEKMGFNEHPLYKDWIGK